MKKLKFCLPLLALTLFIFSCKKDKKEDPAPVPVPTSPTGYPNYTQLRVGNYWVYQQFIVDSMGNGTPTNDFDSCYVEKDTVINNKIYFKVYHPNPYIFGADYLYKRDSLHYTVTPEGKILFSSHDFTTVFETYYLTAVQGDTITQVVVKMEDQNFAVSTPAGTFLTADYKMTYNMYPNWSAMGSPRYVHTRYAKNTGIFTETLPFFAGNPNYMERRLIRYHLN